MDQYRQIGHIQIDLDIVSFSLGLTTCSLSPTVEALQLQLISFISYLTTLALTALRPSLTASALTSVSSLHTLIISAKDFAQLFFDHYFCKNGLLTEIMSDHDKLFVSCFWSALHWLTEVKLKLSTAYHLETNGASE